MAASRSSTVYRFRNFELQLAERRLLADGKALGLGPRGFDLLAALVGRAGHLVTKEELFDQVWPRVIVNDGALQFQISALRRLLGADAIATVSGRGYRFLLEPERDERAAPAHNLPEPSSSFIGRQAEIARLGESLHRARLVTLTGSGGCGKTRLAQRAAASALSRYPDGVWFVELASLADPAMLPKAVMAVLGVNDALDCSQTQALALHLGSRRLLLVLDNAEHLLAACGALAHALLSDCGQIGLLVTSRQALGISGELVYRVPSLALPAPGLRLTCDTLEAFDSVRLFIERARALRPHFAATPQNATTLALICRQLDGIPLAIELAAGRLRSMSLEDLGRRLDQRFSLLHAGGSALARHRTLRSLIDWSYDLLTGPEQALLDRLSVFAGGCSLQAAEDVCAGPDDDRSVVLDLLASLSDKNLLVIDDQGGATRYRLLETVRQYAAERLQEGQHVPAWKNRHLLHFTALAETAAPHLAGAQQRSWFDRLEVEMDNLRAALAWSIATPDTVASGLRLANAVGRFWVVRGHGVEGRHCFSALLEILGKERHADLRAAALNTVGAMAAQQGHNAAAKDSFEEALVLFRRLGDQGKVASALNNLGICAQHDGDYGLAMSLYEQNIAILRSVPHTGGLSRSLHNLGDLTQLAGDCAAARPLLEEAVDLASAHGDRYGLSMSLGSLGLIAAREGRFEEAREMLVRVLGMNHELGSGRSIAYTLEALAYVDSSTGEHARAVQLWGAAHATRESECAAMPQNEQAEHLHRIDTARATLADAQLFDSAWRRGSAMTPEDAVRYASEAVPRSPALLTSVR